MCSGLKRLRGLAIPSGIWLQQAKAHEAIAPCNASKGPFAPEVALLPTSGQSQARPVCRWLEFFRVHAEPSRITR